MSASTDRVQQLHDEALGLQPEGATHDRDSCPLCQSGESETPPVEHDRSDAPTRNAPEPESMGGGNQHHMNTDETMTKETHQALLAQAVDKATAEHRTKVTELTDRLSTTTTELDEAQANVATLTSENERLNGELDTAQVQIKTLGDEKAALAADVAERDERAHLTEVASTRAKQVQNLGLFPAEYVDEQASKWASVSDEDWSDRIEEWKNVKGEKPSTQTTTETASAMTGSSETEDNAGATDVTPRQHVLGLRTRREV